MNDIPDIDIERLREQLAARDRAFESVGMGGQDTPLAAAARFLVSLADQDGELWMENGVCDECGGDGGVRVAAQKPWTTKRITCPGCLGYGVGSRVRVWPKAPVPAVK